MRGKPAPVILRTVVTVFVSATKIIDGESKIVGAEDVINVSVCVMVATYCLRDRSSGNIMNANT